MTLGLCRGLNCGNIVPINSPLPLPKHLRRQHQQQQQQQSTRASCLFCSQGPLIVSGNTLRQAKASGGSSCNSRGGGGGGSSRRLPAPEEGKKNAFDTRNISTRGQDGPRGNSRRSDVGRGRVWRDAGQCRRGTPSGCSGSCKSPLQHLPDRGRSREGRLDAAGPGVYASPPKTFLVAFLALSKSCGCASLVRCLQVAVRLLFSRGPATVRRVCFCIQLLDEG